MTTLRQSAGARLLRAATTKPSQVREEISTLFAEWIGQHTHALLDLAILGRTDERFSESRLERDMDYLLNRYGYVKLRKSLIPVANRDLFSMLRTIYVVIGADASNWINAVLKEMIQKGINGQDIPPSPLESHYATLRSLKISKSSDD